MSKLLIAHARRTIHILSFPDFIFLLEGISWRKEETFSPWDLQDIISCSTPPPPFPCLSPVELGRGKKVFFLFSKQYYIWLCEWISLKESNMARGNHLCFHLPFSHHILDNSQSWCCGGRFMGKYISKNDKLVGPKKLWKNKIHC